KKGKKEYAVNRNKKRYAGGRYKRKKAGPAPRYAGGRCKEKKSGPAPKYAGGPLSTSPEKIKVRRRLPPRSFLKKTYAGDRKKKAIRWPGGA
ncbi:MAG: hypothetical protein BJ554DRAFT_4135, partial [Olpidium bornovanus]